MRLKYYFHFALLFLFMYAGTTTVAQVMTGYNTYDHLLIKLANRQSDSEVNTEIAEGTPYIIDTFAIGNIYSKYGNHKGILMRYNMYEDQIEFRQNNLIYVLDPDPMIKKVELGAEVLVVEKYELRVKTQAGYLTLLDSGKVMLLAKKVVTYRKQQPPKAMETAPTPAQYLRLPDVYYYKVGEGTVMKIKNIKEMIESFPDKQNELTQFAKKEKLSHKKEEDLIKLVRYYNN